MKCYCHTDHIAKNGHVEFEKGNYYEHIGGREMAIYRYVGDNEYNRTFVAFGELSNWKKYFLEPHEDLQRIRNEKLDILIYKFL